MSYRYCLFDLDGTLTDPGVGITNSVMHALRKFGISVPDRSELYSFIGPPLGESFRKQYGFSEEQSRQAVDYYREYFRAGGIFENTVYDGIPELLQALKRKGVTVALATSKPYEFAVQILQHFDLYQYFDYFGAADMDGTVSKSTPWAMEEETLRGLMDAAVEKAGELCGRMREGEIEASPGEDAAGSVCRYCDYSAICRAGRQKGRVRDKEITYQDIVRKNTLRESEK